jgi:hypothetical protein
MEFLGEVTDDGLGSLLACRDSGPSDPERPSWASTTNTRKRRRKARFEIAEAS